ncbi:unnamed protein product [Cylicocyclus nassatus]|uniref:SCP domain-containing protein n=1 Tax=Cylicocyclus nassatus TaxID=53992 RepID=A0AA36DJA5_CYLNA|nr:unnamed protein product [Cylicocyclus nassatus]
MALAHLPMLLLLLTCLTLTFAQNIEDALGLTKVEDDETLEAEKPICDKEKFDKLELTDEDRILLRDYHNNLRKEVANGRYNNYIGNLPEGRNIYKLKYDCNMEKEVQSALENGEARITFNNGYGQNIAKFSLSKSPDPDPPGLKAGATSGKPELQMALESWSNPILYYGLKNPGNVYEDARLYTFANMVYGKTLRIGCGYKKVGEEKKDESNANGDQYVVVSCIYNLIGGYPNNVIYESGSKCQTAADCTTYPGSICNKKKFAGLCVYKGAVPHPDDGPNEMCKSNKGMNDHFRQAVLQAHNSKKSMLALGQVQNGKLKQKLPQSSFMPKMIYDCETEAEAIKYSSACLLNKSDESARPGYGENVFVYPIPNADPLVALNAATENWWSQISEDSINNKVMFDETLKNKVIDQKGFTQMAWSKSVKLGCAVRTCDLSTFVVCRYSPAGNILNQQIYITGSVCSGCAPACNKTEGLCNIY